MRGSAPLPAKLCANQGTAQVVPFEADETCECSDAEQGGPYQAQEEIALSRPKDRNIGRMVTKPFGGTGINMAAIGQGTWGMGESRRTEADEIAARRLGIELGMPPIHTAERDADGGSERVVGRAVEDGRPLFGRFVVSFISENGREFQYIPLWLRWSS